jgi:deazaflavin-dependent oxidoreductase (nitroreductase family)
MAAKEPPPPHADHSRTHRLAVRTSTLGARFAGRRWFPLWGIVEHVGRKSGKTYSAPVAPRRVSGGFVIALPWGSSVDWVRNVQAAGKATVVWKGRRWPVERPEVLDQAGALFAFRHGLAAVVRRVGWTEFLRLHDA